MNPIDFRPIPVRIAYPDTLLACGIEVVLRREAAFDVGLLTYGNADFPTDGGILITDYRLGLQLAQTDRSSAASPDLARARVLVMSGRDREYEIRLALEQGVQGYLPVACSAPELIDAVLALSRGLRYLHSAAAARMASSFAREALTLREQDVLAQLACGECNKVIARRLVIAIGTVKAHVKSIMHKLGASSRTQAICIANERGLIEVQGRDSVGEPVTSLPPHRILREGSQAWMHNA